MSAGRPESPQEPEPSGTVRLTAGSTLAIVFSVTLVLGWSVRFIAIRAGRVEPEVGWGAVGLVWFMAAATGGAAYLTWQAVQRGQQRLEPHRAVNRLVLGKACAVVGIAVAGGYLGYAVAHLGIASSDPVSGQLIRSALAGVGGLALCAAALLLERACRVPPEAS